LIWINERHGAMPVARKFWLMSAPGLRGPGAEGARGAALLRVNYGLDGGFSGGELGCSGPMIETRTARLVLLRAETTLIPDG
jgi:hypothetical protein